MKRRIVIWLLLIILLLQCSIKNTRLHEVLLLAGDNRHELEKVLRYYSQSESDSLKYKATVFLIENMLPHCTYEIPNIKEYKTDLYQLIAKDSIPESEAIIILNEKYGSLTKKSRKPDINHITADYLIANIDHAFMVWQKQPWGKNIPFQTFCEEILPYRIADEPLVNWREYYYNYFQPILNERLTDGDPATAMTIIYDTITQPLYFLYEISFPQHQEGIELLDHRVGACNDMADLGIYIARSLGIPSSMDIILQNPNHKYKSHFWNSFYAGESKRYEWEVNEVSPMQAGLNPIRKRGKIYRQSFDIKMDNIAYNYPDAGIPPILAIPFLQDITSEYFPGYNLTVPVEKKSKEKFVYLWVFDNNNWVPIAITEIKNGKADFGDVEHEIVYWAGYYVNGEIDPVCDPILVEKDKTVRFLSPEVVSGPVTFRQTFRSYRHLTGTWKEESISIKIVSEGGRFQGANKADFSDAVDLHTITESADMRFKKANINVNDAFRYVRYLAPDSSFCNIAEIEFYTVDNQKLDGRIIGLDGHRQTKLFDIGTPLYTKEAAFDGDPLTHYYAKEASGAWVGLDFEKPYPISHIWYRFLTDDHAIREGDTYEVYYFDKKNGKTSLGKQVPERGEWLVYDSVPQNTLLYIKNHSRKTEERIFIYENNEQRWF